MKFSRTRLFAVAAMAAVTAGAFAQQTYSGYFVEGYEYRYRMNPAFGNDAEKAPNFVSVPVIGNLNLATRGNLHLTDVLYVVDGRTALFTNPEIPASKVMRNLSDRNLLGTDLNVNILSMGFKTPLDGYATLSLNVRGMVDLNVPKDLFRLVKENVVNDTYDIKGLGARGQVFGELATGYSRDIDSHWRVGGAVKFYFGVADVDARLKNAKLTLGTDSWRIKTQASLHASGIGLKSSYNEDTESYNIDGFDTNGMGIGGFGMGLDLGAVYTPHPDWQLSAAVLDLGFISWGKDHLASTDGVKTFDTDKYIFNIDKDADNSFKNEWEKVRDDLETLYNVEDMGNQGSRTTMMGVTLNFGAKYVLPVYRKLNFGLVNTTRIMGDYTWTDFRLSANIAPVKMFSASANVSAGTYGFGFGWMLNYHYTGFGLFLGMDHTTFRFAKQGFPLNSNASLNFGMNVLF